MKKKLEAGKKIWKCYKKYKFRKTILKNLKIIILRIRIWKKLALKYQMEIKKKVFMVV